MEIDLDPNLGLSLTSSVTLQNVLQYCKLQLVKLGKTETTITALTVTINSITVRIQRSCII